MRERLVAAFVGSTLVVLALFGVPRAYQVADLVHDQEVGEVERSADLAALLVAEKVADDRPVTPELLDAVVHEAEHLTYMAADGSTVASAGPAPPGDPEDLVSQRQLPDGGSVTLVLSAGTVRDRVSEALVPLIGVVLVLLALSVAAGVVLARRMAQPFQRLALAARQLGTGEPVIDVPPSRVPEVEEIGEAIRSSAVRLEELRRHEREMAVHASHELRTPVTALRLELEDLALWPQTSPEVAAQLRASVAELDRLSTAISLLLDRSRDQRGHDARVVDVDAFVERVVLEWRTGAEGGGPEIRSSRGGAGFAHLDPVVLRRLLETVLEGVLSPTGSTTVHTLRVDHHLEIQVTVDAGPGSAAGSAGWDDRSVPHHLADELAQALGGQLAPLHDGRAGVVVRLPALPTGQRDANTD